MNRMMKPLTAVRALSLGRPKPISTPSGVDFYTRYTISCYCPYIAPARPRLPIQKRFHSSATTTTTTANSSPKSKSAKALPPRPPLLPESEIHSVALKGTGPGGQKINKTSSAIQLKHLPTGIVVKSQATRSRSQNMKLAQRLLADEVDFQLNGETSRRSLVKEVLKKRKGRGIRRRKGKYAGRAEGEHGDVEEELEEDELEAAGEQEEKGMFDVGPSDGKTGNGITGGANLLKGLYEEAARRRSGNSESSPGRNSNAKHSK